MPFTISMDVMMILHGILMTATHSMLMIQIYGWPSQAIITQDAITPAQTAELANAPASASAKTIKPSAMPKKKGSLLEEISKDPDALYAILMAICKEEEAADNHDSEDELSFEASVTKKPILPLQSGTVWS